MNCILKTFFLNTSFKTLYLILGIETKKSMFTFFSSKKSLSQKSLLVFFSNYGPPLSNILSIEQRNKKGAKKLFAKLFERKKKKKRWRFSSLSFNMIMQFLCWFAWHTVQFDIFYESLMLWYFDLLLTFWS